MRHFSCLLLAAGLIFSLALPAHAQNDSRFGVGVHVLGSTAGGNVGPGINLRASTALNSDVSVALGTGLTGFIFRGRDDAAFAFDPQVSTIVTFPTASAEATYVLGGVGAYVPFGDVDTESGPTFNLGVGRVWRLQESSLFVEFSPGFLIGKNSTTLVVPLKVGVIL